MRAAAAWLVFAILFATVLTGWAPGRWWASILEVGAFSLAGAWLVRLAVNGERPRWNSVLLFPAVFVLVGAVQIAFGWTIAESETVCGLLAWSAVLALMFGALQTFEGEYGERFLRLVLGCGFAVCVLATLQTFTAPGKVFWLFPVPEPAYLMGPFLNHNHYAMFVELLLPLALIPAFRATSRQPLNLIIAGVMIASVVASASRSGFVLVMVETPTVALLCAWRGRSGWRRTAMALAAVLAVTAGLTAVVGWSELAGRLGQPDPFSGRRQMLASSMAMIRDHGLRGVGLGNWPVAYPSYAIYDDGLYANQAHNDWVQWTAEGGVAALGAALFLLAWTVRQTLRTVWCAGPLFVLVHALFDYPFQNPQIAGIVFTLLAVAASETRAPAIKLKNTS